MKPSKIDRSRGVSPSPLAAPRLGLPRGAQ
jgi:hypothetical protein